MNKINIDSGLYERAKQAASKAGYSSVEEFVAHAIEIELKRVGEEEAEKHFREARSLGYEP